MERFDIDRMIARPAWPTAAAVVLVGIATLALLSLRFRRFAELDRYPSFALGASMSHFPYLALDLFSEHGPTRSLQTVHAAKGPILRLGPDRIHLAQASPQLIRAIGRLDKSTMYCAFDFEGHQTLFSERTRRLHSARGNLSRAFTTTQVDKKRTLIDRQIQAVVDHLHQRIASEKQGTVRVNLLGLMQAMGFEVASQYLFDRSPGCLEQMTGQRQRAQASIGIFAFAFFRTVPLLVFSAEHPRWSWLQRIYDTLRPASALPTLHDDEADILKHATAIVEEHLASPSGEEGTDSERYLDILSTSQYYRDMDRDTLRGRLITEVVDVCIGSAETTGSMLAGALVALYATRRKQIEAIRAAEEDEERSRLLDELVEESFWLTPLNVRSLDRVVGPNGLMLDNGDQLPPGTVIGLAPQIYHDARYTDKGDDLASDAAPLQAHVGFGYPGPRSCVAKNLGRVELRCIVDAFVRHFDIVDAQEAREAGMTHSRDRWMVAYEQATLWTTIKARKTSATVGKGNHWM